MKKLSSILLFVILLLHNSSHVICYAEEYLNVSAISINSNFADNSIIVVFDNESSLKFNEYNSSDFIGIDCKNVIDLTTETQKKIKARLSDIELYLTKNIPLEKYDGIALSDYHQIICLELNKAGKENVIETINKIQKLDGVLLACPNYKIKAYRTSDDPHSLDYKDDGIDYLSKIGLYNAWDITTGSNTITVGVIDSGISEHPDLNDNLNTDMFVDCRNQLYEGAISCNPGDDFGHGTGVAGIIGAVGDNNVGISGICGDVQMISIKVLDRNGVGTTLDLIEGVQYAIANNIDIINISLGGSDLSSTDEVYYNNLLEIIIGNYNGLAVCAAGNDSKNLDVYYVSPAVFECNNMLTVGASTSNDYKLTSSNHSTTYVDLFAPGDYILSTMSLDICPDDPRHNTMDLPHYNQEEVGYHLCNQTSFATPFVTGVAALMLSVNPNLTAVQLKDIITRTVDIVPALQNYCVSGGRLNAYKAVRTAQMYYCANDITYEQLSPNAMLYTKAHGVWYDNCKCSCRNNDLSCDSGYCDFGCNSCENCHYYLIELHNWHYSQLRPSNISLHRKYCIDCGYTINTAHNWESVNGGYECTDCGQDEAFIPGEVMSLSDEELELLVSSMSEEELAEFIASLPEDALASVTALLPPVDDDELLTE